MRVVKGITLLVACVATALLAFTSCEQSTSPELSESFQEVKEVSPIVGGQNTTMELEVGDSMDSFFAVTLKDGITREGWCIEWGEPVNMGLSEGVNFYSTKGKDTWKELNYFMSIKNDLRAADPDLTFREVQVIIWSLIDNPAFDVDKIGEYKNISERIYKDGQPLFSVQKVKDIVNKVKSELSQKSKHSTEEPGVIFIENDGQTIMVGSETAFAVKTKMESGSKIVDTAYSTCFDEEIIDDISFPNWGWTNGPISPFTGELKFDIYTGAGGCDINKGTFVGELTITYSGGTFTATYKMTETSPFTSDLYTMTETHLYVGNDPYPTDGSDYTVAPGQYGNQHTHNYINEYTYEITGLSGDIYFIAHAVVNGFDPDA